MTTRRTHLFFVFFLLRFVLKTKEMLYWKMKKKKKKDTYKTLRIKPLSSQMKTTPQYSHADYRSKIALVLINFPLEM